MRNRQFVFAPKIEYKLVAERSEANQNSLTFPVWCRGRESNPHEPKLIGFWDQPVYQFQHRGKNNSLTFQAFLDKIPLYYRIDVVIC